MLACGCGGFEAPGGTANTFGSSATQTGGGSATGNGSAGTTDGDDVGELDGGGMVEDSGDPTVGTDPGLGGELCNGLDDDGDGQVDEGFGEIKCGMGACVNMAPACEDGVPGQCVPLGAGEETCNNVDDDCDGSVDEELSRPCSTACGDGTEACEAGAFTGCTAPQPQAETCDATDENCDGALDEGVDDCRRSVHRSYDSSTGEHFYTTSISEAQCCGFSLEAQDFYAIYIEQHAGLVPWNRCIKNNGFHFYTTAGNCEGTTLEGTMGYVANMQIGDSRPLYRAYNPNTGDHFYTTSEAEHDNAVAGAYQDEGIACYVW